VIKRPNVFSSGKGFGERETLSETMKAFSVPDPTKDFAPFLFYIKEFKLRLTLSLCLF